MDTANKELADITSLSKIGKTSTNKKMHRQWCRGNKKMPAIMLNSEIINALFKSS